MRRTATPAGRHGISLVETLASVLILALAIIILARLTAVKIDETTNLTSQYSLLTVDAFLADIYHDFHACSDFEVNTADPDSIILSFSFMTGVPRVYEYNRVTGMCYEDGREMFSCASFSAIGAGKNLSVAVKLPDEKRLELNVYR